MDFFFFFSEQMTKEKITKEDTGKTNPTMDDDKKERTFNEVGFLFFFFLQRKSEH